MKKLPSRGLISVFLLTIFLNSGFISSGFLCAGVASAQQEDSRSVLNEVLNKARYHVLSNGIRVILYRRGIAPVFGGAVVVRVGGTDEQLGETGISHMLEHMAFKGTPVVGTKDYEREKKLLARLEEIAKASDAGLQMNESQKAEWESIGAELTKLWENGEFTREYEKRGASGMNATTDKEFTKYFNNFPRSAFEFWCWMESERLLRPVMRQFYQERDVVMEERRMRFEDDPEGKLYERLLGVSFLMHPYRNPVIGYDFDIKRLTASRVDEFRRRYYVPENIVVSVVGDVNPESDIAMIEQYFGRLPTGKTPPRPIVEEPPQQGERRLVLETKNSPQLAIAYHKVPYPHPDDPPLSLMQEILGGSSISPLQKELVKKRQIASSVDIEEAPGQAYPNLILVALTVKRPHTNQELLQAFDGLVEKFKQQGVSEENLMIAKRSIAMEYLGHMRSNLSLALDFASSELLYDDWKTLLHWYDQVMAVTSADVKRVANQYLVKDSRTIGFLETKQ